MRQAEQAYVSGLYLVVVIDGEEVEVGRALREAGILAVNENDPEIDMAPLQVERIVRRLALNR